jgi:hypothetical protein
MTRSNVAIKQSNFKFNLNDLVIVAKPVGPSKSLKGTTGFIVHRGYHDSTSNDYANLYAIITNNNEQINGMVESWLIEDITQSILEDT